MPGIGLAPGGAVVMEASATSSPGRLPAAGLASGSRPRQRQRREPVERAGHSADRRIGDAGVKGGGVELSMAERVGFILRISILIENQRPAAHRSVLAVATGCAGR